MPEVIVITCDRERDCAALDMPLVPDYFSCYTLPLLSPRIPMVSERRGMGLEVRLLGQFDVRRDAVPVIVPSRAAQSLFAYLILSAGTPHRREKLAGQLWPDTSEENARKNLRHELWRLRKAVEVKTRRRGVVPFLHADDIAIGFNAASDYWLDVSLVRQALGSQTTAEQLILELSLYRGELLPGWYDEWVVLERERLQAIYEQKMARLLALLVESQRWAETVEWGERWIALGQTPEPAYRALMRAHGALGNISQVASVYERCRRALQDDLGVDPSAETRRLFERLSKGEGPPETAPARAARPSRRRTPTLSTATKSPTGTLPQVRTEPVPAPLQTARPHPGNLPVRLSSFIGREREIGELKRTLTTTRLLTLIGAGGLGKTSLAIELARDVSSDYKEGTCWVDLVPITDPSLVPQAVAKALGIHEVPNVPVIETLADSLCSRHTLLALDNCEHVVAACAQLAQVLLASCNSIKILATSREALGITGEVTWRVPSLSLPEAEPARSIERLDHYESTRLFIERARAANSDLKPTKEDAMPIAQICRRLDGIPLAIELAAARVKTLSLSQIASRLDDRFNLLTRGSRTALPRHQTLRATIDWSYELLTEQERILFRRLSAFAGGWTLEAAEFVCAGDGLEPAQVLELLSRLVDKSLVIAQVRDGAARYHMLETIRQYGDEKSQQAGDDGTTHRRHLEFFERFAEESESKSFGAEQITWFNQLDGEMDNLRAAIEWSASDHRPERHGAKQAVAQAGLRLAGALWYFFYVRRHHREGSELLKQILVGKFAQERTIARAKALNAAGYLHWVLGSFDAARPLLEEALAIAEESGDRLTQARAYVNLGLVAAGEGESARAKSFLQKAVAFSHEFGDAGRFIRGLALVFLGDLISEGDVEHAHLLFEESAAIMKEIGNDDLRAYPLRRLGYIALHQGNLAKAVGLFKESLTLNREVGHQTGVVACLAAMAATCVVSTKHIPAVRLYGAVGALLAAQKSLLLSSDRGQHDHYLAVARGQLDPATLEAAWSEGSALSMDQAITYAWSAVEELPELKPVPNNLPVALSSFVGRNREIDAITHLLAETRLLTLTGSGGVGKTRLALKVANELLFKFKDGVWWTDLVGLMDEALVPQAVAGAVGVREVPNQPVSTTLVNYLRSKQLLLILDNCEHVVEGCAKITALLLSGCPELQILTTSREALGLIGEVTWRVPSLSLPDPEHLPSFETLTQYEGVRLFVERARAVNMDFVLTGQNAQPVARICQRVDGIPLAIELAAARVKTLSVQQIAERLDDRLNLLTQGSRTALPRHHTLRATIDWSHELLSEPEKTLFRRLSVFAGGWTLDAAEVVGGGDALEKSHVLDVLARLVDKSIVIAEEQDGASRYRMLETIRQYAREKLGGSGEEGAMRQRHLEFFVNLAKESEPKQYFAEQSLVLDRLELEIDNLRAAVDWATENRQVLTALRLVSAIPRFWFIRAHHNEGLERLKQLLALPEAMAPTVERLRALNAYFFMLWPSGRLSEFQPLIEEALALGMRLEDRPNIAAALRWLGVSNTARGEYALARRQLEQSLEIYRELGDWNYSAWGLVYLGEVELLQGEPERAQGFYEQAIPRLKAGKDLPFLAIPLRRLGQLAMSRGDLSTADAFIKESLTDNWSVHDYRGVAACLAALSALSMRRQQLTRAVKLLGVVDAILDFIRTPILPFDQEHYQRNVAALRAQLPPVEFEKAWAEGHAISLESAIVFAFAETQND